MVKLKTMGRENRRGEPTARRGTSIASRHKGRSAVLGLGGELPEPGEAGAAKCGQGTPDRPPASWTDRPRQERSRRDAWPLTLGDLTEEALQDAMDNLDEKRGETFSPRKDDLREDGRCFTGGKDGGDGRANDGHRAATA